MLVIIIVNLPFNCHVVVVGVWCRGADELGPQSSKLVSWWPQAASSPIGLVGRWSHVDSTRSLRTHRRAVDFMWILLAALFQEEHELVMRAGCIVSLFFVGCCLMCLKVLSTEIECLVVTEADLILSSLFRWRPNRD